MMTEIGRFLAEGGIFTVIGFCAIGAGLCLLGCWHLTRPEDGRKGDHRRPAPAAAKPWQLDTDGHPIVHVPAHRFAGTPGEETRRLMPITQAARARVVLIGPEGIIDDEEASRAHRARTEGRVRRAPAQGYDEEEGGADCERGQLPREAVADGEEGGADTEDARPTLARWFRNAVTGEYIFVDEWGRKVDFDS
jgi:hypothetical protein